MHKQGLHGWALLGGMAVCAAFSRAPVAAQSSQANTPAASAIHWTQGPVTAKLGDNAEIAVPRDYLFTDGDGARKAMEMTHNPATNREVGLITPKAENESWFIVFEYDPVGFVQDDEKSSLDSKAILESIQKGTEEENETRKKNGWEAFHITGWYTPPYYDQKTHNVTWAVNGEEDKGANPSVNYSVRILGRKGTMNVDLVLDPKEMGTVQPVFNSIMNGFRYTDGNRYADFVRGDKLAGYGLTALIAGGAGAVAVKTGLLAKFWKVIVALFAAAWKFILVVFAAIGAYFKRIWAKIKSMFSGGGNQEREHPSPEPEALGSTASRTFPAPSPGTAADQGSSDHVGD
jgi:uncharacterized membrane-anchored protein